MNRLFITLLLILSSQISQGLGFANGIKIGEISDTSVVIWARLTTNADASNRVDQWTREKPNWVVPGQDGEMRIILTPANSRYQILQTEWHTVNATTDYCHQHRFSNLQPEMSYHVTVEGRAESPARQLQSIQGSFTTAPKPTAEEPILFAVSTCQEFELRDDKDNGHRIYQSMLRIKPRFFIQTGDTIYYDRKQPLATNTSLAHYRWHRMYALPFQREFHRHVPTYWMHDDHDLLKNDCWPGQSYGDLTWDQGVSIWNEQIPQSKLPYRTFRWGRNVQVWLPEGRLYRSPNKIKDGPEKTILGETQWKWLEQSLASSDATYKFYVSATPVVGPDRKNKKDNHANEGFSYEGERLRKLLSATPGCVVINGDRHWQYHSVDPETGLNEFGCGPASDSHAGGYSLDRRKPCHRFLRIKGGFLTVRASNEKAVISHHKVDGEVVYQATLPKE